MDDWRAAQSDVEAIAAARHGDPFSILGPHSRAGGWAFRVLSPDTVAVNVISAAGAPIVSLSRRSGDFFEGFLAGHDERPDYRLEINRTAFTSKDRDPYAFGPALGPLDDHLLLAGDHRELYKRLGAHVVRHEGADGVLFALWAPNASRISVVGDFNDWDGRRHQMRKRFDSGLWEFFVPELRPGAVYKYEVVSKCGELQPLKADPFAFAGELRPSTASIVVGAEDFAWTDGDYLKRRAEGEARRKPMTIYEVHLGSWRRGENGRFLTYEELADQLIPYAVDLGFTHLELLPISEHPLDESWGYQPIGLFAPTRRFGPPEGFARFVDRAHAAGLGVILDWVPAHFPVDAHGLARFDGAALYEHADPRKGFHPDWNTAIYDYGRREVADILQTNALYWLDRFHVDGLRVDAVASMLYLDYSRKAGEWIPNVHGGNENLDAIAFLKRANELAYGQFPGTMMIAEESTAFAGVSKPVHLGGLGFGFKWNMGWMHDTLDYIGQDAVHRRWSHDKMSFGLIYAFTENFILPISHDEVVHGKGSLMGRMPGDEWQRFANARAYLGFMWGHPGKKLLFMGQEFGQTSEWNASEGLPWWLLDHAPHQGVQKLVRDLNRLHREEGALHARDCEPEGFAWLVVDDDQQSVFAFARFGGAGDPPIIVACNFTPVVRRDYRIGLPKAGRWIEILNSDAAAYGGGGVGNLGGVDTVPGETHGQSQSALVTLPPLAAVYLRWDGEAPSALKGSPS